MNTPPIQVVESETPDALDPLTPLACVLASRLRRPSELNKLRPRSGRPPVRAELFPTHPDPAYRCDLAVIDLRTDREVYLVTPEVLSELSDEIVPVKYFIVDRQGVLRLWPIRLPGTDGKTNSWWDSARAGAEAALQRWVRVKANMDLGAYEILIATAITTEPKWPELSMREILQIAFKGHLIDSPDHPVVEDLRGKPDQISPCLITLVKYSATPTSSGVSTCTKLPR